MRRVAHFTFVPLAALVFAVCDETGFGPDDQAPIVETEEAVTQVLLTDAPFPFDKVARVDIFVVAIRAAQNADTGVGQTELVTFVTPNRRFDLLALQGGTTASLGDTTLPASVFRSVRLTINTDSSSMTLKDGTVLTGTSTPGIRWQVAGEMPLNALVHEPVEISDTGAVVVIDFDVGNSFHPEGADSLTGTTGFVFIPHVRAVNSQKSGTVTGTVVADDGQPIPDVAVSAFQGNPAWPENTWSRLGTSKTDAQGNFRLAYLWPRTYIVAFDAPVGSQYAPERIGDVVVSPGSEIALGTVVLPNR